MLVIFVLVVRVLFKFKKKKNLGFFFVSFFLFFDSFLANIFPSLFFVWCRSWRDVAWRVCCLCSVRWPSPCVSIGKCGFVRFHLLPITFRQKTSRVNVFPHHDIILTPPPASPPPLPSPPPTTATPAITTATTTTMRNFPWQHRVQPCPLNKACVVLT